MSANKMLALSGGVGGAKLALGLSKILSPENLSIIANTADDFEHMGLHISPDLDTVMYTLAGLANTETGWGLKGESWNFMSALKDIGGEAWFQLGDKDLATHVKRTKALASGYTLSEVTRDLCLALGVRHPIVPMTDDSVRTKIKTQRQELDFQHYFVREKCEPAVQGFRFAGQEEAMPAPLLVSGLQDKNLGAIIICPSNPFVSVDPILGMPGVRKSLQKSQAPIVAVSPIVGGNALKGPAAKMMDELGLDTSVLGIAKHYQGLIDGLIIDEVDAELANQIGDLGITILVTKTIMISLEDRIALAEDAISFAESLYGG